jgi:hypothetical protein
MDEKVLDKLILCLGLSLLLNAGLLLWMAAGLLTGRCHL